MNYLKYIPRIAIPELIILIILKYLDIFNWGMFTAGLLGISLGINLMFYADWKQRESNEEISN